MNVGTAQGVAMIGGTMPPAAAPPRTLLRALWDALLARPTTRARLGVAVQLVLIPLWHVGLVLVLPWAWYEGASRASARTGGPPTQIVAEGPLPSPSLGVTETEAALLTILAGTALLGAEGIIAFIPFRIVARRLSRPFAPFVRAWWRTCLWGSLLLPLAAYLEGSLTPGTAPDGAAWPVSALYLLLGPAVFAEGEVRRSGLRMSRWRPVCPECGYSLRRAVSDRCPECGEPFPTTSRVYRRWAVRRLPWDRRNRGSLLFAYINTVLLIVFCPCRASRGLVTPDHHGRPVRWAVGHLLLAALLGTVAGSELIYPTWFTELFAPVVPRPGTVWENGATHARFVLWIAQSFLAWLIVMAPLPALGVALGAAVPGRHPAAQRAIARWSLYGAVLVLPLHVAHCTAKLVVWASTTGSTGLMLPFTGISRPFLAPSCPPTFLAVLYGLWWARGVSAIPYLSQRRLPVFAAHAALFICVWLVLAKVLFPATELASLL